MGVKRELTGGRERWARGGCCLVPHSQGTLLSRAIQGPHLEFSTAACKVDPRFPPLGPILLELSPCAPKLSVVPGQQAPGGLVGALDSSS